MTLWGEQVVAALKKLKAEAEASHDTLDDMVKQDLRALDDACSRILSACTVDFSGIDEQTWRHDFLNTIGAVRGYTEMLLEEHELLPAPVTVALQQVLAAVQETKSPTASPRDTLSPVLSRAMAAEVGVILAVDDMPENRELVSRLLHKSGHTVITAESGEEALELLATHAVDVVLLDLMMPGIGGREVLTRMKTDAKLRATPVIMISGRQDMDQIVACIQAGADDYLLKPFNPVLLQARIAAGIERKRWYDKEEQYRQQLERNERFIRATFGRYLSDDIVSEILESPEGLELGGDLREVTIMMSDIRGFTTLSEHLSPQRVVQLLNRYLGRMTDIILEHQGTIDEFLGDAVLAVFGAPKHAADDADRAVRCALAMQAAMAAINLANAEDQLPQLEMAIALNTGNVIAGNIGSERRAKYGFVGHAMNVTSRIEDVSERGQILISASTRDKLPGKYRYGEKQVLSVRGIEEHVVVYPVLGLA
jgi:class 3 adenylate cyclase